MQEKIHLTLYWRGFIPFPPPNSHSLKYFIWWSICSIKICFSKILSTNLNVIHYSICHNNRSFFLPLQRIWTPPSPPRSRNTHTHTKVGGTIWKYFAIYFIILIFIILAYLLSISVFINNLNLCSSICNSKKSCPFERVDL